MDSSYYRKLPLLRAQVTALHEALFHASAIADNGYGTSEYDEDAGVIVRRNDSTLEGMAMAGSVQCWTEMWKHVLRIPLSDRLKPLPVLADAFQAVRDDGVPARLIPTEDGFVLYGMCWMIDQIDQIIVWGFNYLAGSGSWIDRRKEMVRSTWDPSFGDGSENDKEASFARALNELELSFGLIRAKVESGRL